MIFDDIVSDENGESAWTQLCEKHRPTVEREYHGASDEHPLDECTCGVEGCSNFATHYFTFYADKHLVVLK